MRSSRRPRRTLHPRNFKTSRCPITGLIHSASARICLASACTERQAPSMPLTFPQGMGMVREAVAEDKPRCVFSVDKTVPFSF